MITAPYTIDTQAKTQLLNSNATLSSISGSLSVRNNLTAPTGTFNSVRGTLTTPSQPNITSVGTLTNLNVSGSMTGTTLYETNVNFTNTCKGPTGSFSNIDFGGLPMLSNCKGSTGLSGCYTVGTEQSNPAQNTVPNFTFTSNSQNGYVVAASSIGRYSYPAYYAFINGGYAWWSQQNAYNPDGGPSSSCATLSYNYGQSVSTGEYVSISCPNFIVLTNCTFINTDGFFANFTFKSVAIFGQYNTSSPVLLGTYTMGGAAPAIGTYSFAINTTQAFNKFYFQITQCGNQSGGGVNYECAVQGIVFTGTLLNKTINQNLYIPQSLEIGRTPTPTLNTTKNLIVNGDTSVSGNTDVSGVLTVAGNGSVGGDLSVAGHVFRSVYAFDVQATGGSAVAGQCYCNYGTITINSDPYNMFVQASGMKAPRTGFYLVCFDGRIADTTNLLTFEPRIYVSSTNIRTYQAIFIPGDNYPRRSITWSNVVYMPTGSYFQPICGYNTTLFGWNFSGCYLGE